jgi:hypothetical protein
MGYMSSTLGVIFKEPQLRGYQGVPWEARKPLRTWAWHDLEGDRMATDRVNDLRVLDAPAARSGKVHVPLSSACGQQISLRHNEGI